MNWFTDQLEKLGLTPIAIIFFTGLIGLFLIILKYYLSRVEKKYVYQLEKERIQFEKRIELIHDTINRQASFLEKFQSYIMNIDHDVIHLFRGTGFIIMSKDERVERLKENIIKLKEDLRNELDLVELNKNEFKDNIYNYSDAALAVFAEEFSFDEYTKTKEYVDGGIAMMRKIMLNKLKNDFNLEK